MEKENGDVNDGAGKQPPDGVLDAAGLFGAYWGRDGGQSQAQSAAAAQAQAALFGFGSRYPPPTTLGVAANQAASLGLHPAASAAWWQMASHLAAQDYLARLQASGLNFPHLGDPYSALSALSGGGMGKTQKSNKTQKGSESQRPGRTSSSSSLLPKDKSPASTMASSQANMRSSYGFPKTSSPSTHHHQQSSLSSLASLNNMVSSPHQKQSMSKPQTSSSSQHSSRDYKNKPSSSSSSSSNPQKGMKERELALLRGDLMLAQAAAQGAYHAAVAAAAKGKNISSLYPFGMTGSDKDRHPGIDSLTGLPHSILSDPSSVLGGVRLPPDTEIIKYTSSLAGPKSAPGSTNRGRKKTISLDPPQVSVHPATSDRGTPLPSKRAKVDDYSRSSVEVIRLPNRPERTQSAFSDSTHSFSDYTGISRELLQTIASQSGVSLAALEKQLAGAGAVGADPSMKLSKASTEDSAMDLGVKGSQADDDAPLNLSLKPRPPSNQASDALSRLTSLSSSLSASSADRSRRKPGAVPRRVAPEVNQHMAEAPRPKSSGSEDSELSGWPSREGRPRNLGRGVSKPKKNTVASLLAQSRALGLRPALAHQLLAETDLEKLKALLGETASTDSECPSDSCPSDSDASETSGKRPNDTQLRLPLALGWKRVTVIRGLSRNCSVKGDVTYTPPDPHSNVTLKSTAELNAYLDSNPCPPLNGDNFTFSSRVVIGDYIQPTELGEPITINETEIIKRLEEARTLALLSGRPTPPPVDRRIELARRQQAARDARRDVSQRNRDQARYVRELERSERAESVKRDKEAKSQQLLEAERKKHGENERMKIEEQKIRHQERELKRQQSLLLKEQQKYITEERERRRQHTSLIRQLDARKRWEERERRKHQNLLDRLLVKEKKLQRRRKEMELLSELRRPQEDSTLSDHKPLPTLNRIPGLKLPGQAMADLLQVYEFLHNFGQTLGFDLESIPSLNTFQQALLPDCNAEVEQQLVQVLTQLLVCAIEDPGIPHPGRHTTLLGQAIRMGDITPLNISEVLRIYLYANATGEVKALTGLTAERERERRVADHHQSNAEMMSTCATTKNLAYYESLHTNDTYKLAETLKETSFLALNPTNKAKILAFLCNELLQNKSVLRQIDASLEHLNQLKKERYLLDMKIRKVRVQHTRKVRSEQTEKQQAIALERMQKLVEENTVTQNHDEDQPDKDLSETREKETTPSPTDTEEEQTPTKDDRGKSKEILNNNKEERDKDSVMGDCDGALSDLESEGTQPEEDEDKNLSSEELTKKLEKLVKQSDQQIQQLIAASHALRATCYGQDRYWRRYWSLGRSGGVYVEGLESGQPEIRDYHRRLEEQGQAGETRGKRTVKKEPTEPEISPEIKAEEALKTEMELKSIKSELNLSDHTQIIKYEANMKQSSCKTQGPSIKMEEKFIQQQQNNDQEDLLDIEDSIPTAFLVQKPTLPVYNAQESEKLNSEKSEEETKETEKKEEEKDDLVNNLEELRKMAEAVSSQLDAAKKAESGSESPEIKEDKQPEIKTESMEIEDAHALLYTKMLEGKWFSILRHETSFLTSINDVEKTENSVPSYKDNEQNCAQVINSQGHKWDVSNNLHLLNDPSLFTLNSMVTTVAVPLNNIYTDSSLTMSGIDQEKLDMIHIKKEEKDEEDTELTKDENDVEKELKVDSIKAKEEHKTKINLSSLGLLNFNALSTYVTCDSPPPIQMTSDEIEQLENCKVNGLPKKVEGSFVPKELRYGWWRITDPEQLTELVDALHPRGVRERELYTQLTQHLPVVNNKRVPELGDIDDTELSISHLDRVIGQSGGYPSPDPPGSYDLLKARKVDMHILGLVEALEERVAAASMQVKGWRPSRIPLPEEATTSDIIARARHKLAQVEAHIERRYLKPPLVQRYASTTEATLGAALQAEHGNSSAPSPQSADGATEVKETKGISRGLATWREAVSRCSTASQLAMALQALEAAVAWDKSIMKANCQFCSSGDNEDQLLLCDGCDKGYHTYCFKPRMEKIPEGDWYCWECVNKARVERSGERVCIVCGGGRGGRTVLCTLCPRAYHPDCHYPPLGKNPRGKWYCSNCISKAPPKKPRNTKKRDSKQRDSSMEVDHGMVPSPAPSHASTSTTAEDSNVTQTPEKCDVTDRDENVESENGHNHTPAIPAPPDLEDEGPPAKRRAVQYVGGNGALEHEDIEHEAPDVDEKEPELPMLGRSKKEKAQARKTHNKEMQFCKSVLCAMECHEHAWPFLIPVNTKQFPQYKKVIKAPMDLSTIKKRLHDGSYKSKEDFAADVRLIFSNCEVFNEDDSPVGRAGHNMRQFFENKWTQI